MDLQISFKELITDIPKINSSNLFCSIYLQEQSNYIFQANITLNTIHCLKDLIILSKNKEKLQFRFQTNKIFLGSISIPIEDILNKSNKDFSQWYSIFVS